MIKIFPNKKDNTGLLKLEKTKNTQAPKSYNICPEIPPDDKLSTRLIDVSTMMKFLGSGIRGDKFVYSKLSNDTNYSNIRSIQ
jgi:hypothetical protein